MRKIHIEDICGCIAIGFLPVYAVLLVFMLFFYGR